MIGVGQRLPRFRTGPQMKPGPPHRIELNPRGRLSPALTILTLFENISPNLCGMRDYANAARTFDTSFQANGVQSTSPYGGQAYSVTTDVAQAVVVNPATATPTSCSVSFLAKFDGTSVTGRSFGCSPIINNIGGGGALTVDKGGTNKWSDQDLTFFLSPAVTTLTTWTRLAFTWDGTTVISYANGIQADTAGPMSFGWAVTAIVEGFPWPMADLAYWTNRVLTAAEVMAHYRDPYGTTLRPKYFPLGLVGSRRAGGLLLRGVGP